MSKILAQGHFVYHRETIVRDFPLFSDDVLEKESHFDAIHNQKMVLSAVGSILNLNRNLKRP